MGVDLYRYDERWERPAPEALGSFFDVNAGALFELLLSKPTPGSAERGKLEGLLKSKDGTAIIDLRQPADFDHFHLPGSVNLPFAVESTPSPFSDPTILASLWKELEGAFKNPSDEVKTLIQDRRILSVCYDGDSSRVATSVLRAKGYEADNVRGGFKALDSIRQDSRHSGAEDEAGDRTTPPWLDLGGEAMGIALSQSARVTPPVRAVDL